jgi:hypothetical protein
MKLSKLAKVNPFAHFLGIPVASSAGASEKDDEREQGDDESDEDYAKRMEELDDEEARKAEEERKKEEGAKRAEDERKREEDARRAEEDDDDEEASEEDKKEDREEGKRAGRAKGARQRERIRCARILASGIKAGRVNQACVFAFDSTLTASAAVAALGAADLDAPKQAAARPSRLSERMQAVQTPNPGANSAAAPSADPAKALADRIVAVAERVRGK